MLIRLRDIPTTEPPTDLAIHRIDEDAAASAGYYCNAPMLVLIEDGQPAWLMTTRKRFLEWSDFSHLHKAAPWWDAYPILNRSRLGDLGYLESASPIDLAPHAHTRTHARLPKPDKPKPNHNSKRP